MKPKNCISCGAPLRGAKCGYCGTEYSADGAISAEFGTGEVEGTLTVGDKTFNVYIGKMETQSVFLDCGRDITGRFIHDSGRLIHKFTLIEI